MTPGAISKLDRWAATPGFRDLTIDEAAAELQDIVPHYPHPDDHPLKTCVNGYRWFATEMEAVADAIYRSSRRMHGASESLASTDWDCDVSPEGLWAIPGRCRSAGRAAVRDRTIVCERWIG